VAEVSNRAHGGIRGTIKPRNARRRNARAFAQLLFSVDDEAQLVLTLGAISILAK